MKIIGSGLIQQNISSYSLQTKARFSAKMALLILALPITLLLSATALRNRMVTWLNQDLLCEDSCNIWKKIHMQALRKRPDGSAILDEDYIYPLRIEDFYTAFSSYPKTLTFLSRCFSNPDLLTTDSSLPSLGELYNVARKMLFTETRGKLYLDTSEKYLDLLYKYYSTDSLTNEEIKLVKNMVNSSNHNNFIDFLDKLKEI